jgi:hypothetical protein
MFEAGPGGDSVAGQERELRRTMHQSFEGIQSVRDSDLADRVHSSVNVEGREAFRTATELGKPFTDLLPCRPQRVACHYRSPVEARVIKKD